jgi:putative oxidoreductase
MIAWLESAARALPEANATIAKKGNHRDKALTRRADCGTSSLQLMPNIWACLRLMSTGCARDLNGHPGVSATFRYREDLMESRLGSFAPLMLSVLRIMSGLLFLEHGTQKFLSFPAGERAGAGLALAGPGDFAGIIELVCGVLIALGLFTRPAAFLASGTMAVAYFMAHAPQNFFPVNNMGDAAILYCFVFLYFIFAGPGPISLDAALGRRKELEQLPL